MSKHNEFSANAALAACARPIDRTRRAPRPMSRPERDIRATNRMYWFGMGCGMLACTLPLYVLAIEVFVK